jgi:putative membrane protein
MKAITLLLVGLMIFMGSCNNAGDSKTTTDSNTSKEILDNNSTKESTTGSTSTAPIDEASSSFLMKTADAGMAEVHHGELAQQKTSNQAVKDFAAMMVRDHSAGNDQVKAIATQKNVTLPSAMSEEHQKMQADLSKKTGKAFDKAYIDGMVKGHEKVIKEFEDAANKSADSDVKSFIGNTLPTLNMHLDSAKAIQKRIK